MEAKEFRIGNKLLFGSDVVTIDRIDNQHGECVCSLLCLETSERPITDFYPIPLTQEWMSELGLDKNGCVSIKCPNTLQVTKMSDVLIYDENDDFICLGKIEYVHQLQNLYFALTGEELTLKTKD